MAEVIDSRMLKALGAETRQSIMKMLSERPYTASEISRKLGKHVTTVKEHLETLEKSGFISRKDSENKWIYYCLTSKGEKIFKPGNYSWVIVMSLSALVLVAGLYSMFPVQQDFETASVPMLETGIADKAVPADNSTAAILVVLALIGFVAAWFVRRSRH